jgi:hypothetical protein
MKMPRRASEGAKILRFFEKEPLDKVKFVYDMVRDIVRDRLKSEMPSTNVNTKKRRRPNPNMPQATEEQRRATGSAAD